MLQIYTANSQIYTLKIQMIIKIQRKWKIDNTCSVTFYKTGFKQQGEI